MMPLTWAIRPMHGGGFVMSAARTDITSRVVTDSRPFGHVTLDHIEPQLLPVLIQIAAERMQADLLAVPA